MDIFSHGLWGGIAFGRKNRRDFWVSVLFGILPDILSFGPFFVMAVLGFAGGAFHFGEPPSPDRIPALVYAAYNVTHSLVIFAAVFGFVWFLRKKAYLPLAAWGLHILVDIPTHSSAFFPTPFLWPVSSFYVSGIPWGTPIIFIPDIILLVGIYAWFFWIKRQNRKKGIVRK